MQPDDQWQRAAQRQRQALGPPIRGFAHIEAVTESAHLARYGCRERHSSPRERQARRPTDTPWSAKRGPVDVDTLQEPIAVRLSLDDREHVDLDPRSDQCRGEDPEVG